MNMYTEMLHSLVIEATPTSKEGFNHFLNHKTKQKDHLNQPNDHDGHQLNLVWKLTFPHYLTRAVI